MRVEILQLVGSAITEKMLICINFNNSPLLNLRLPRRRKASSGREQQSLAIHNITKPLPFTCVQWLVSLKAELRKWVSQWQKSLKSILTHFPEKTRSLWKALNRHYHQEIWNIEIANACSLCAQNYFLTISILTTVVGQGALENGILKVAQC